VSEILGESIADVDHRVQIDDIGKLKGFCDTGGECQVPSEERASEVSGDEEEVSDFCAASEDGLLSGGHVGEHGDVNREGFVPAGGVASAERAMELLCGAFDPGVKVFGVFHGPAFGEGGGADGGEGDRGHGGAIAETAGHGFVTDLFQRGVLQIEMHAFEEHVRCDENSLIAEAKDGHVITDSFFDISPGRISVISNPLNEFKF